MVHSYQYDEGNNDYQQFKTDVVGIGTTCVEGIDVVTTTAYDVAPMLEKQSIQVWKNNRICSIGMQ